MDLKILKKINGAKTDSNIDINECFIFLKVETTNLLTQGTIDIDYLCYINKEDESNQNIKPFKLLKEDGERLLMIDNFQPTEIINQLNYAEQCKIAFLEAMDWISDDLIIEED